MHKSQKITQITSAIIAHANSVAVQHDQYVSQFVTRGRQELYMLLSDIYAVLLSVNASKQSKQILNEMRASIQTAAVNAGMRAHVPKKSSTAIVVRYITRAEPKTISVYKRVFESAIAQGISVADLPSYITASGGVDKCGKAIKVAVDKKAKKEYAEKVYKAMQLQMYELPAIATVQFPDGNFPLRPHAADVMFEHMICKFNNKTEQLEVVGILYPTAAIEQDVLDVQFTCAAAAGLDRGMRKGFYDFCDDNTLNVDILQRWMKGNGIVDGQDAYQRMAQLKHYTDNYDAVIAERKAKADAASLLKIAA